MGERSSVFSVLRIRDVRQIWGAGVVSDVGNFMTFIALAVRVHDITGRNASVGLIFSLQSIPWFTFGPLAGVLVDRADKRLVMVGTDLVRAGLVATLAFSNQLWQLYLIAFLTSCFSPLFRPARQSVLPQITTGQDYVNALAVSEIAHQGLHTVGPALGGAAVLAVGARGAFLIDAATFVASALMVARISVRGRTPRPSSLADVRRDLSDGAKIITREPVLRSLITSRSATLLADAALTALLIGYVRDTLHRGAGFYGLALAVGGIGTAVLAFVLARLGRKLRRTPLLILAAASPLLFVPLAMHPGAGMLLALMGVEGMAITGLVLFDDVIVAEHTPEDARGRVFSLSGATSQFSDFSGSIAAGVVGDAMGAGPALAVFGAAAAVLGLAALMPGLNGLRKDDDKRRAAGDPATAIEPTERS